MESTIPVFVVRMWGMWNLQRPGPTEVECLGDLQGPKFRVGELAGEPVPLQNGDILELPSRKVKSSSPSRPPPPRLLCLF